MTKINITTSILFLTVTILATACVGDVVTAMPTTTSYSSPTNLIESPTIPPDSAIVATTTPTRPQITVTPTPTAFPSLTSTPESNLISTPKSSITLSDSYSNDTIFVWNDRQYGWLNPHTYQENSGFVFANTPETDPSFQAETLAFSQNSHQVAYVFYDNHAVLWITDINLEHTVQLWIDEEDWLTYFSEGSSGYITWGLNDHFIFLSRKSIGMVYQLLSDTATHLSGRCERIAKSPLSNLLAVWCPISNEQGNAYMVLEQNGSSSVMSSLPDENIFAQEWVFAPGSNKVLYADEGGNLVIWDGDLNSQLDLEMLYGYRADGDSKIMKWSYDGTKVIIFGYLNGDYCPTSSNGGKLACWSIRDANTGEIFWWPNEENLPSEAIVALTDGFEVALSPDNQWLALSYQSNGLVNHTIVVSITTGISQEISSLLFGTVFWSK